MTGLPPDVSLVLGGFAIGWLACILGVLLRMAFNWLSGKGDSGDPGL